VIVCANCGEENPDRARYCLACAAELQRPATLHEERKVVSVLFVDLVGFTASSDEADPEDVRATLRPFHQRVKEDIERFGGTVEKYIGDAVMAVFGAPVAREDDAERAVRAGLRVLETTQELGLDARAAVNTGEAVVALDARADRGEGLVAGDVVNTAARLQSAAATGTLVAGELTYRTTADRIEYEPLEPVTVKGKAEPVKLWHARQARSRLGVDADIREVTPFVGRTHELTLLQETYARVEREAGVQLVTIVGEPGVGKTRLLHELGRWLDDRPELVYWRQGRCLPYGEGVTFWALGEIVKAHAGILETDVPEDAVAKLELAVSSLVADATERDWLVARLAPLAGLGGDDSVASREESFSAWRQFLEALATERPTVVLLEDIHWADDAMLGFVEHLLDWSIGVPLLVLCTARPELYERHAAWGGGKRNASTVSLSPLSGDETARLLSTLLSEAVLPAETQGLLLERCGGNPLYAEQFVRMLTDRGIIERRGHVLRVAEGREVPVPETVQALIAARLDTLGPERKALVQDASVVGKVFWAGAVAALGNRDEKEVGAGLVDLAHMDLVRPARTSSFAGEREFVFTHLLVRDVAYGQIPRGGRAQRHRDVAGWIERTVGDRVEDQSELLAYHYEEALALARAASVDAGGLEPLRAAAVRFLKLAGDRARDLDGDRAVDLYQRALALASSEERPPVLLALAGVEVYLHRVEDARSHLEEAAASFRARNAVRELAAALILLEQAIWLDGGPPSGHREEAVRLLETEGPSDALAEALAARAGVLMMEERAAECLELCERALPIARATGSALAEIQSLEFRGISRVSLGDVAGVEDCREALRIALESGKGNAAAIANTNLGYWIWWVDGPEAGGAMFRDGIDFARRRGLSGSARWSEAELFWTLYEGGGWDEVLETGERMVESDSPLVRAMIVPTLARIHLERGAHGRAAALVDPLLPSILEARTTPQIVVPAYTVAAGAALAGGDRSRALELLAVVERETRGRQRSRAIEVAEAARIGAAADDVSVASTIVADPYPRVARAESQHVSAEAVLAEFAGDPVRAFALYRDAAARWKQFGHVAEQAHAHAGASRCAAAAGEDGTADAAAARALFERVGATLRLAELDDGIAREAAG
jgi:class 3 adenylate cyclase/tetratricopeptide (TPR) repeat protein